jgi:membrane-associated phospholipid phosphatase
LVSFALGALILWLGNAPRLLIIIALCYVATVYSLAFVNLFYKASGHTSGVAGPAVIYLFLYGPKALPVLFLIPLIMWARIKEKEHSLGQTIAGAVISSCATFLVIRFL